MSKYRDKTNKYMWGDVQARDGTYFTVEEVMRFLIRHMRFRDLFDLRAIVDCYEATFYYFLGDNHFKCPRKNWKFYDKDVQWWWSDEEEPA